MVDPKEYLEFIVRGIVNHPDAVQVERTVDDMGVLLSLTVHPEDMPQTIGKMGATAKAMRTLVRVCGMRKEERVNVKIIEPEKAE